MDHPAILPDTSWMLRACCTVCEGTPRSYDVLVATKAAQIDPTDPTTGIKVTANLTCPQQHQNHFVTTPARWRTFVAAYPERRQAS